MLQEVLEELFEDDPSLFPPDIKKAEKIPSCYHCFPSLRRALDTRAPEMKVAQSDIDFVNCWGQEQRDTHGIKIDMAMRQHYAQPELYLSPFLRYTHAM